MVPSGRTEKYDIWRACERFGIRPPGLKSSWEECDADTQCELLAYENIRETERLKEVELTLQVMAKAP